jgi:hypothetical protein
MAIAFGLFRTEKQISWRGRTDYGKRLMGQKTTYFVKYRLETGRGQKHMVATDEKVDSKGERQERAYQPEALARLAASLALASVWCQRPPLA